MKGLTNSLTTMVDFLAAMGPLGVFMLAFIDGVGVG